MSPRTNSRPSAPLPSPMLFCRRHLEMVPEAEIERVQVGQVDTAEREVITLCRACCNRADHRRWLRGFEENRRKFWASPAGQELRARIAGAAEAEEPEAARGAA